MSLATRCSNCSTMFRVVQDQLRVSEGWVRCGRCDTVFNAFDALVDMEAEAAAVTEVGAAAITEPTDAESETAAAVLAAARHPAASQVRDASGVPAFPPIETESADAELRVGAPAASGSRPMPDEVMATRPRAVRPATGVDVATAALRQPTAARLADDDLLAEPLAQKSPTTAPQAPSQVTPGFVRRADRDARWTSPAMRAALAGSALILLALLALQVVYHQRDWVAARYPAIGGVLRSACAHWGCRIEAPRRLHEVTLEGSALSRIALQPRAVKLSINLRNRSAVDVALPSIDLSLTDAQGQLIARRALSPSDFHIDPALIARGAELPLETVLTAGEQNIIGYTVELFYP